MLDLEQVLCTHPLCPLSPRLWDEKGVRLGR